jgi:transcriptional regulator with GAF, ATPase, and Fis domain
MPMLSADVEVSAEIGPDHAQETITSLRAAGLNLKPAPSPNVRPIILICNGICDNDAQRVLEHARRQRGRVLVITMAAAPPSAEQVWRLIEAGAGDVLHWHDAARMPPDTCARLARWQMIDQLADEALSAHGVVGRSPAFLASIRQLVEAAYFTDDSILITGETGTGKELASRLVHALDRKRSGNPLILVDAGAIVPALSGSEFFGHERGAFTGAAVARKGAFAEADGGVIFLDEVGELPPDLQVQLLRVLQEKRYKRVGGNIWHHTDFRLVAATNRDLRVEVQEGRFRRDLYYRLAVWSIELPPLAERGEDILPLAEHFLGRELKAGDAAAPPPVLSPAVRAYLQLRPYPGNIRDLQQLCMQMRGRHVGSPIYTAGDIPQTASAAGSILDWQRGVFEEGIRQAIESGNSLKDITAAAADTAVRLALAGAGTGEASRRLKVTPRAIQLRRQRGGRETPA